MMIIRSLLFLGVERRKMGCGYQILHTISIITISFILISLQSTHIFIAEASLDASEYLKLQRLQEYYFMEEEKSDSKNQIVKVSGDDESGEEEVFLLKKFRALLGLRRRFKRGRTFSSGSQYLSPSPSPSPSIEAEAPAPAPARHKRVHSHHPLHKLNPIPKTHKIQEQNTEKGGLKKVLIAVLVSAVAAFVVFGLGFFWVFGKFRKQKKSATTMAKQMKKGRKKGKSNIVSSQNSANKVSSNPVIDDLFYLNSLGVDLEQQSRYLKKVPETVNTTSNHSSPERKESESDQELVKSASSTSSTREIMSVHEDDAESVKYESDGAKSSSGDKIIPVDCHSSDDESFHSFNDSHSSNIRLSNVSAGSLSDISENLPSNVSKLSPIPDREPDHEEEDIRIETSSDCIKNFTSSPPPPPPPPPPPVPVINCFKVTPKASGPFALSSVSSPPPLPHKSPNASQAASSIPTPPCPPPFLNRNSYSTKGPPPPPSQFPQQTPLGKDGAPLPKLKPLHWDKVRAAPDHSMVWDKLRSSSFEFDEEMIESLFGYNIQSSSKDEANSKTPSPSKHVLEPKRLQNITILSKALNVTAEQACEALLKGDGLSLQQLEAIVRMVLTKEEEVKLSSYKGDTNELGFAEQFVKAILNIPFAFQRAVAMLYRETFEDEVVHLRNSFSMLEEACKELRSSRLFLKLLEAVLKTGNRMNVGTIRGGARAFKLDALLKLADVKGTDGRTTLLHFVVQEIIRSEGMRVSDSIMGKINQRNKNQTDEEKEEDYRRMGLDLVSGLSTELYNVKKTATIDLDVLASSVSNLSEGMSNLQHLVQSDLKIGDFVKSMKKFMNHGDKMLKELKEDEDRVLLHVREITEYFHGNVSKDEANPLRIFVIVRDFLGMLDHVCKELRSSKMPTTPNPLAPFR